MNIVHVIGNGFDLNQGLPTSYAHFYEFYFQLVPQEKDTEAVRKIRELLEKKLYDKRDSIAKKDMRREAERALKERNR